MLEAATPCTQAATPRTQAATPRTQAATPRSRGRHPNPNQVLLYSTEQHGCSLRTAYNRCEGVGPTVLLVLDGQARNPTEQGLQPRVAGCNPK